MKDRKLAFVINTLKSGGAERVVTILANHLARENEIVIITLSKMTPFYPLDPRIRVVYCKAEIPPSKNTIQSIRSNIYLAKRIYTLLREHSAELCISFMTTTNILSAWAANRLGIPLILSERNNPQFEDKMLSPFWKVLRRFTYPKAACIVVQTITIRDYFVRITKKNNYVIIPNPINPEFKRSDNILKENIILNVGRLSDQKGQDVLIRAFARLPKNNWNLMIVGEGPKRTELEALIERLNLKERVFLPGRTHDVEAYYQRSKIFAFTSNYEGFPNALLEALHFGLACVSTDCPTGPSELIQNRRNGILVEVGDEEMIANALQHLIDSPEIRSAFGKEASKTTEKYSSGKIVRQWEDLIVSVLGERQNHTP